MIVHILSDSPYTFRFIEFINNSMEKSDHTFFVQTRSDSKFIDFYNENVNCRMFISPREMLASSKILLEAKAIIIHQLNQPKLLLFISIFYPKLLNKMTWVIWGGDAHFLCEHIVTVKERLIAKLYSHAIKKFAFIASHIPGDYKLVTSRYSTNAKYINLKYPSPIDEVTINRVKKTLIRKDGRTIMVGNSADPSNNHIDAFVALSKFVDCDIKILAVLSYGGNCEYIDSVIKAGKNIFGSQFVPVVEYLSFEDYLRLVSSVDVCVFNHRRQQGMGNLRLFFTLGTKVFISSQVTTFSYYKTIGIDLYATEDIPKMQIDDFFTFSQDSSKLNISRIEDDLDSKKIKLGWDDFFRTLRIQ